MPFAAMWMDLETTILSGKRHTKTYYKTLYKIMTYMWNLKTNTNEYIYKSETDSQI